MLKNSKTLKFLATTFVVAAFAFTAMTVSAMEFGSTTLRVGSKGEYVKTLQTLVGATADGNFGLKTKEKVMTWQAANGLTADGLFGLKSMAKANGTTTVSTVGGCATGAMFSATTGAACTTVTSAVPGCAFGAMFSATTGASCTTGTASGTLMGGAGSATFTELSNPSASTRVGEGDVNKQVFGFEVEADSGSDLAITSVKLELINSSTGSTSSLGSGSKKLDRYAKNVSIWYNGAKVGSALPSEFTEDSNLYTKSITLSGAVVKAGATGKFYVAVDVISDIDSGNVSSTYNTWSVELVSARYADAAGAVLTDTTGTVGTGDTDAMSNTFIFDSLANTNDVELKVNLGANTPVAKTVKVSTTTNTNQVELMQFTLKAQGSKMAIDQIPVSFVATGTSATDLDLTTSNVILVIGGKTYSETLTDTSTAGTEVVNFDNLGINLAEGESITGIVYADLQDLDTTNFAAGDTLTASITSALVAAVSSNYIDAEDSNGDQLATGDRTGSATGNTMTFRATGVNAVMGTPSYDKTVDSSGNITQVIYTIPVAVTSFGNTLYMGQTAQYVATATASNSFAFVFQNSSAPTISDTDATASKTLSSTDAVLESNGYRLDDGQTKHFTLEVTLTTPTTAANSYRVALKQLRTFTDAGLGAGASNQTLLPVENFQTAYKLITS